MSGHERLCILIFLSFICLVGLAQIWRRGRGGTSHMSSKDLFQFYICRYYVFLHCWTLGMMSKATYPLMLIFSSLSADYNYFNHSCYQSRISVHICQQLLCNKSELSYYIKHSLAKWVLLLFAVTRLRYHNWLILSLISLPPLTLAPSSLLNSCWLATWWNRWLK